MAVSDPDRKRKAEGSDTEDYRKSSHQHIFKLLRMGYDRLDSTSHANSEETDITGELVKFIQEIFDEPAAPRWCSHYAIHEDPAVNKPDVFGKRRKRLDIGFERTTSGKRYHFSFEAKRLSKDKSGAGEYFGKDGLGMFLSGEYSRESDEAGMLGYVQSDDLDHWAEKLSLYFNEHREAIKVRNNENWREAEEIRSFSHRYHSKHDRVGGLGPIAIFHVLLKFC